MFSKNLIPSQDSRVSQYLSNVYAQIKTSSEEKTVIEKMFKKKEEKMKEKIINTVTVSKYLDELWKQSDLKPSDKEIAIRKLVAIEHAKKEQIASGIQKIAKIATNLNVLNDEFKMSAYEEFNYQEKLKDIKRAKKLDMENALFMKGPKDLDILHALNRPSAFTKRSSCPDILHYTAGLADIVDEEDERIENLKKMKAEEFVKKIKVEKKEFKKKIKEIEQTVEIREKEEIERYKKKLVEEEEEKRKEKKKELEDKIKILKTRSETRLKQSTQWEEEYKVYLDKKPLFKELENRFKKVYVIPELEQRKKKLQEIRNFHKPITREEILEHDQKVSKILEERSMEKREHSENSRWNYRKPDFESRHHKTVADELARARRHREYDMVDKMRKKEKVMELMLDIKDRHLPRVDPQKEYEMMALIERLKKKNQPRSKTREGEEEESIEPVNPKKIGAEYLKIAKQMAQKRIRESSIAYRTKDVESTKGAESDMASASERNLKRHNSMYSLKNNDTTITTTFAPTTKINYLTELRRDNKIQSRSRQVERIMKNEKLDPKEKSAILLQEIRKLEEKAKRKEMVKKFRTKKDDADISDDAEEIDQIYMTAIKAKMGMLLS